MAWPLTMTWTRSTVLSKTTRSIATTKQRAGMLNTHKCVGRLLEVERHLGRVGFSAFGREKELLLFSGLQEWRRRVILFIVFPEPPLPLSAVLSLSLPFLYSTMSSRTSLQEPLPHKLFLMF